MLATACWKLNIFCLVPCILQIWCIHTFVCVKSNLHPFFFRVCPQWFTVHIRRSHRCGSHQHSLLLPPKSRQVDGLSSAEGGKIISHHDGLPRSAIRHGRLLFEQNIRGSCQPSGMLVYWKCSRTWTGEHLLIMTTCPFTTTPKEPQRDSFLYNSPFHNNQLSIRTTFCWSLGWSLWTGFTVQWYLLLKLTIIRERETYIEINVQIYVINKKSERV